MVPWQRRQFLFGKNLHVQVAIPITFPYFLLSSTIRGGALFLQLHLHRPDENLDNGTDGATVPGTYHVTKS
jgi:hypothetical protein